MSLTTSSKKFTAFFTLFLATIPLSAGSFIFAKTSMASQKDIILARRDIVEVIGQIPNGIEFSIACYKGSRQGYLTGRTELPTSWTKGAVIESVCGAVAAGVSVAQVFVCPNCRKEYKQYKDYKIASCPKCRKESIKIRRR